MAKRQENKCSCMSKEGNKEHGKICCKSSVEDSKAQASAKKNCNCRC